MPDTTSTSRDKRGRWQPGSSGNPRGRPVTNPARRLLMENAEELVRTAIEMALNGDTAAINTCLARILPQYKPTQEPVQIEINPDANLAAIGRQVLTAATAGECPPDVATSLLQGLGILARITEFEDLKDRMDALERAIKQRRE